MLNEHASRQYRLVLPCLLLVWTCPVGTTSGQEESPVVPAGLAMSFSPVVDLHFHVRTLLDQDGEIPPDFAEVVKQAREFEQAVGDRLGWGFIEPLLTKCETAGELIPLTERLPERFRLRSGPIIEPRATSVPYARALAQAESAFMREVWPAHRRTIETAHPSSSCRRRRPSAVSSTPSTSNTATTTRSTRGHRSPPSVYCRTGEPTSTARYRWRRRSTR